LSVDQNWDPFTEKEAGEIPPNQCEFIFEEDNFAQIGGEQSLQCTTHQFQGFFSNEEDSFTTFAIEGTLGPAPSQGFFSEEDDFSKMGTTGHPVQTPTPSQGIFDNAAPLGHQPPNNPSDFHGFFDV